MAGIGKRGGDRVLESRHLVGLFLGVVLLCGVFFTLGYVMGKTQYTGAVHAASSPDYAAPPRSAKRKAAPDGTPAAAVPAPNASEWDFYGKKQDQSTEDRLQSPAKTAAPWATSAPVAAAPAAVPAAKPAPVGREVPAAARFRAPRITRGAIVLQVAALRHQGDALAMAEMLQQKRFPSFVVTPTSDRFYRVQVGPYRNERAAESARGALERAGFKAIIKR
ncbi:MAG: SPOR domain-containing protein [Acidobacteriota bacterium]|nr:SPOR domain-containing protein [Acidobacteriota bacterium]